MQANQARPTASPRTRSTAYRTTELQHLYDAPPAAASDADAPAHNEDEPVHIDYLPTVHISTICSATEGSISTAILDTGSPGDNVGETCLRRDRILATTPLRPPIKRGYLGDHVPPTIGRLGPRLHTTNTTGYPVSIDLPDVHILQHMSVPLLLGLESHSRHELIVHTAAAEVLAGPRHTPIQ